MNAFTNEATELQRDTDFRALFDQQYRPMVALALRIVHSQAEAEEVVQDAYADLYRRWSTVLNPVGYLRSTVVNGSRRVVRRRLHRDEINQRIGGLQSTDADDQYLLDVLATLPENQRTALTLAYFCDFTRAEIAEVLDCKEATARSLVHRALKSLRKELDQ